MELFGIAFSIPAAFGAGLLYSFLIYTLALRYPWLRKPVLGASALVCVTLAAEWWLLATAGAVRSRELIGPAFYPAHLAVFVLSSPALASVVVLGRRGGGAGRWLVAGILCAAIDLPVVLTQYYVSESLYGVDGAGGPYGRD